MTPILYVSGWGFKPSALEPLAAGLQEIGAPVFTSSFDCLREGNPIEALKRSIERCAAPPWVVGWSMGGTLAVEAVQAGARVEGLALLSSTPRFCEDDDYLCGTPVEVVRGMKRACRADPATVLGNFMTLCASTPDRIPTLLSHQDLDATAMVAGLDYLLTTDLRKASLPPFPPILLVHGKTDRITPLNAVWEWKRLIPAAQVTRLEGIGHDLPLAVPRLLAGLILNATK